MESYHERAFSIVAKYDCHDDLFWWHNFRVVGVLCSDFFDWATADLEEINSDEDAVMLEQAYKDVLMAGGTDSLMFSPKLYAARKRKRLPGSFVKFSNPQVKALFDKVIV